MQICQFLIGVSYAGIHSFISYDIPVRVLSKPASVEKVVSVASASFSSATAAVTSAGFASFMKKALLRAAGGPSVVPMVDTPPHSTGPANAVAYSSAQTYHTEYQTIPCIDTSGQTFAIWLNVLYLAPLTALFVRFFVKSYLRRSGKGSTYSTVEEKAEKAAKDALKGLGRELYTSNGQSKRSGQKH